MEWLKVHPDGSPDALIWPYRGPDGVIEPQRRLTYDAIQSMRHRFAARWRLPWLTSKAMRKFVKGALVEARMPSPVKEWWQGHKPKTSDMDAIYGTRPVDETFELQLRHLPSGPIGIFATATGSGDDGVPAELAELYRPFKAREIDAMEFAKGAKRIRGDPIPIRATQ